MKSYKSDAVKKAFIENMQRTLGNITESCKAVNISRSTFYEWRDHDEEFARQIADVEESCIDFAESKLKQRIAEGDTSANIFYLKTKGRNRGYNEKVEYVGEMKMDAKIEYNGMDASQLAKEINRLDGINE